MRLAKYELKNLSIIVEIKVDSQDRINNLNIIIDHYNQYFNNIEILIIEQGKEQKFSLTKERTNSTNKIIYHFIHDQGAHYKTRNMNLATNLTTRPIVMMTDADVFLEPNVLLKAIKKIEKESLTILSPHNGVMVEISKSFWASNQGDEILDKLIFFPRNYKENLDNYDFSNMYPIYGGKEYFSTGGCLLYHKSSFNLIGGWNTNIISYGYEDMEFVFRAKKLGMKHASFRKNNIYHLEHYRGIESRYNGLYRTNEQEWKLVCSLTKDELRHYALNGFKMLKLDASREYNYLNQPSEYHRSIVYNSKIDLGKTSILVLAEEIPINETYTVSFFLKYLEQYFKNYEVNIVEKGSNNCNILNNKLGVKYNWFVNKKDITYKAFLQNIVNSVDRSVILIWDHYSFIRPGKINTAIDNYLKKQDHFQEIRDSGWQPQNIGRVNKFGLGLLITSRRYLLSRLELDKISLTDLFS